MEENQQNTNDKKEISVLEKRTNTIKKTILICDKIICALRYAYAHKFPGNVYKDLDKEKIMLKSHHMRYNQKENRTTKNKKEMFEKAYILLNVIRAKSILSINLKTSAVFTKRLHTMEMYIDKQAGEYISPTKDPMQIKPIDKITVYNKKYESGDVSKNKYGGKVDDIFWVVQKNTNALLLNPFSLTRSGMFELAIWFSNLEKYLGSVYNFKRNILNIKKKYTKDEEIWYSIVKPEAVRAYSQILHSLSK